MARFVLDTSAILALRSDERGAARVDTIVRAARAPRTQVMASFMTRMEILYRIEASEGAEEALSAVRLLDATGLRWVGCEPEILVAAARIKASGGLSVADAWIAATALVERATLVHKDPEFRRVREVSQEML